jgi:hypothetical protein
VADSLGRPPADPDLLLATLAEHEVEFLVVGGVAVVAHGHPRLTFDLDILPNPSADNMQRLAGALKALRAVAFDDRGRELALDLSHPESLALGNYFLKTDGGALDLFNGPRPELKRYRRIEQRSVDVNRRGTPFKVIGRDDLIAMKEEAGREKDLADIAALTAIERAADDDG